MLEIEVKPVVLEVTKNTERNLVTDVVMGMRGYTKPLENKKVLQIAQFLCHG